jgi:LAO/AO transport system kinase
VGQSETLVHSMVDFFLLMMLAGAGDELQGIKRGIMEMADAIVINKADGNNIAKAKQAKGEYQNALHLFPLPESHWSPVVTTCSAHERKGIEEVWEIVMDYVTFTKKNHYFGKKRTEQNIQLMHHTLKEIVLNNFYRNEQLVKSIKHAEKEIKEKKITSYNAAKNLSDEYFRFFGK